MRGLLAMSMTLMLAVLLSAASIVGCASSPEQMELASLKLTKSMQDLAHSELSRQCSSELVASSRDIATTCLALADRNVAWQVALEAADYSYLAARSQGDAEQVEKALAAANVAACEIVGLFPGVEPPAGTEMPKNCPEWSYTVITSPECVEVER